MEVPNPQGAEDGWPHLGAQPQPVTAWASPRRTSTTASKELEERVSDLRVWLLDD